MRLISLSAFAIIQSNRTKIKNMAKYYKKNRVKKLHVISLIILLLLASGLVYVYSQQDSADDMSNDSSTVNLEPPTEEEQAAGDEIKDEVVEPDQNPVEKPPQTGNSADSNDKKINVVITDASQYGSDIEVRAFASNHIEDGTCTITFSKAGQQTIQKEVQARADASTTICSNLTINRSEFPTGGEWSVVVSYNSQNAKGSSNSQIIKIQ
jgi:hypothetical protein